MPPEREIGARDRNGRARRARRNAATGKPANAEARERGNAQTGKPPIPLSGPIIGRKAEGGRRKADGTGRPESTARLLIGRTPNALQASPGRERQVANDKGPLMRFMALKRPGACLPYVRPLANPPHRNAPKSAVTPPPRHPAWAMARPIAIRRPSSAQMPHPAPSTPRPAYARPGGAEIRPCAARHPEGPGGANQPGRPAPPLFPLRPVANHYLWHCPPGHAKPPGQQG